MQCILESESLDQPKKDDFEKTFDTVREELKMLPALIAERRNIMTRMKHGKRNQEHSVDVIRMRNDI